MPPPLLLALWRHGHHLQRWLQVLQGGCAVQPSHSCCATNPASPRTSCSVACSAFAKLDVWLEQNNVLNELTEAPRTQMEGTLSPEQKEVGGCSAFAVQCVCMLLLETVQQTQVEGTLRPKQQEASSPRFRTAGTRGGHASWMAARRVTMRPACCALLTAAARSECRPSVQVLAKVRSLTLDDAKVSAREQRRLAASGGHKANWGIQAAYYSLCWVRIAVLGEEGRPAALALWQRLPKGSWTPALWCASPHQPPSPACYVCVWQVLDVVYANRPIERFWFLETVARMPYFVYISMVGTRPFTKAN